MLLTAILRFWIAVFKSVKLVDKVDNCACCSSDKLVAVAIWLSAVDKESAPVTKVLIASAPDTNWPAAELTASELAFNCDKAPGKVDTPEV